MRNLTFLLFIVLAFSGCNQDIKSLSKKECRNLGYKFIVKKRLNYRTGKYETSTLCLNNRQ